MEVELNRVDDAFHFEAKGTEDVAIHIDGSQAIGAAGAGARPMELILMGLGGCSAIDVISILKKQRQTIDDLKIVVKGDRAESTPAVFTKIHIEFHFKGKLDPDKAKRAIDLSVQKYCSVSAMLEKTAGITWSCSVN